MLLLSQIKEEERIDEQNGNVIKITLFKKSIFFTF